MENIYKITVHFILETLIAGYEEGEAEEGNNASTGEVNLTRSTSKEETAERTIN